MTHLLKKQRVFAIHVLSGIVFNGLQELNDLMAKSGGNFGVDFDLSLTKLSMIKKKSQEMLESEQIQWAVGNGIDGPF